MNRERRSRQQWLPLSNESSARSGFSGGDEGATMPNRSFTRLRAVGPKRLPEFIRVTRHGNRLLRATALQM